MATILKSAGVVRQPSTLSRNNSNGGNDVVVQEKPKQQDNNNVNQIDSSLLINPKHLTITSRISEGSTAIVYEGWYKNTHVAVKVIKTDKTTAKSPGLKEGFVREVMMLSRVEHDNLVKFYGACMQPNMMIVMELMKGGSLQKYLMNMRPCCPDLQTSISYAMDIAQVMEFLHSNGIIHRDLKPGNLLLTEDKKKVKLGDFGLAREESVNEMMSSEVGTPRWMAPELYSTVTIGERKNYDRKVDIYSFAIVLWELLTNATPFKGMTSIQAAYAIYKKERPSVDNLPSDLVPLLESCWHEDPANRPEFKEIIATLSKFLDNQLTQMPPPTLKNVDEQQSFDLIMDSPGTRHLMEKSGNGNGRKSRSSSPKFLRCFDKCFTQ